MSFTLINFFGLPSLVDRGELLYAHWTFVARLNTIVNFLENIRPLLPNCSHLLQDLVEFLLPKLIHCDNLSCKENSSNRKGKSAHNYELVVCVLNKFLSPMFRKYSKYLTQDEESQIAFYTKPLDRKYITFS